jgi:hypothetical protein
MIAPPTNGIPRQRSTTVSTSSHSPRRTSRARAATRLAIAVVLALAASLAAVSVAQPAGADICLTCPDDPPPPPGPPPAPRLQYTIDFDIIHAYATEDADGDETQLKLNGSVIWERKMAQGMTLDVDRVRNVGGTFSLSVYDEDGPFDNDDHLGTVTFNPAVSQGYQVAFFTLDDADYLVGFRISPPFWV